MAKRSTKDVRDLDALTKELNGLNNTTRKLDKRRESVRERFETLRREMQLKQRAIDASQRVTRDAQRGVRELQEIRKRIDHRLDGLKLARDDRKTVATVVQKENKKLDPAQERVDAARTAAEEARRDLDTKREALTAARNELAHVSTTTARQRELAGLAIQRFGLAEARLREGFELQAFLHLTHASRLVRDAPAGTPARAANEQLAALRAVRKAELRVRDAGKLVTERDAALATASLELDRLRSTRDGRIVTELQRIEREQKLRPRPRAARGGARKGARLARGRRPRGVRRRRSKR